MCTEHFVFVIFFFTQIKKINVEGFLPLFNLKVDECVQNVGVGFLQSLF